MKGFHYTSFENWKIIQKEGLKPLRLEHQDFGLFRHLHFPEFIIGTWVWETQPQKKDHLGNILRIVAKKNTTQVVLLQVAYKPKDAYHFNEQPVRFTHYGSIETFIYHKKRSARIITKPIPPDNIHMVGYYDLLQFV